MTIGERALQIAQAELGTREIPAGSNNVRYNTWFYRQEVYDGLWGMTFPWCMAFVQWCYDSAGQTLPYRTASCSSLLAWYQQHDPAAIVHEPRAGDIAILDFGARISHTGIVESAGKTTVTLIEGNTSLTSDDNGGAVMRRTRRRSDVRAYIRPFYKEDNEMIDYDKFCEYMARYEAERAAKVTDYAEAEAAMEKAVAKGVIRGGDAGLMPKASVSREQLVITYDRLGLLD